MRTTCKAGRPGKARYDSKWKFRCSTSARVLLSPSPPSAVTELVTFDHVPVTIFDCEGHEAGTRVAVPPFNGSRA